ncbi:hypothetical protein CRYUN_Cryun22dG0110100 [Craigia yunnanensis]
MELQRKQPIAGGLVANPVIAWSLYTLKTTGCGLPPGPGGSIGALEGVSYLVVVGIVGWSLYTITKTGSGLPNGPFGLLGAVEGLSFLSLLAILGCSSFRTVPFQDPSQVTSASAEKNVVRLTAALSCACGHGLLSLLQPETFLLHFF